MFISELGDFKLGDFGVARTAERTMGGMSKKGTYVYMAPEVYKGEKYGSSADVCSLGIVLYKLCNGNRFPFLPNCPAQITFKDKELALYRRMRGDTMPAPADASKQLAEIILKACSYDPKKRFSSPTEMRECLERVPCSKDSRKFVYAAAVKAGADKTHGIFSGDTESAGDSNATVGMSDKNKDNTMQ